jgi:hypothetical protein
VNDLLKENEELRAELKLWQDGYITRVDTIEEHVELLNDRLRLNWLLDSPVHRMAQIKLQSRKAAGKGETDHELRQALRATIDALRATKKVTVKKEANE